jgi:3-oxoacyl-[acyl-carrier-protein] synthase I
MSAMPGQVYVVGTGASTAVGLSALATAAAVRAGIAGMARHPFLVDKMAAPMVVCANPSLPIELGGIDRLLQLAVPPAMEALRPVLERARTPPAVSVLVALPEERPGTPSHLKSSFAERFSAALAGRIKVQDLVCQSLGHAGGFWCMEQALSLLRSNKSRFCLVGGIDSYLARETLEWLDSLEQLHSETTIWGFCPGEAGGFCLLASRDVASGLNPESGVELVAAASATEANPIKTDTVCVGQGLSDAFARTLAHVPADDRVAHTICDMNGEPYRANEYGFAVLRSPRKFGDDADFQAPADCWGDVGAASGPLFVTLATISAHKGYAPGPLTFLWASSEHGLRASALLRSAP